MPDDFEEKEQYNLTKEFIRGNPTTVSVYRPETEPDGAGGTRTLGMVLQGSAQIRFLEQEGVRGRGASTTLQGFTDRFLAIALPDADILVNDHLEDGIGNRRRVIRSMPETTYRKRLEVVIPDGS